MHSTSDAKLMSENAVDDAFKGVDWCGSIDIGNNKVGQSWIDNTQSPNKTYFWNGSAWIEIQVKGGIPQGLTKETLDHRQDVQDPAATATTIPNKLRMTRMAMRRLLFRRMATSICSSNLGSLPAAKDLKETRATRAATSLEMVPSAYKGGIDATTAPEPTDPKNGDFYVNTADGTSSWTA